MTTEPESSAPGKVFGLFLKVGHTILDRVLMLVFDTSCTNRPFHNEHENAICAKK